jgi:DNA repair exonuclease SbcCD ATPase subunit
MWRACFLFLVAFAIPAATFGQTASSDSQTLQALLSEVRELRQELRISLARTQSAQILLSRVQTQQAAFTRASERLNDARSKLADAQTHQKDVRNNLKRFEDALSDEQNPAQQKELRDRIYISKAELENSTYVEQCQATEIEAEQQLRAGQDKLNALETQLDELVGKLGNPSEQPGPIPR